MKRGIQSKESLQCLRLLASEFPKCVKTHFRKKEFEKSKAAFGEWYESVKAKLPAEYRDAVRLEADAEFKLFEEEVLS